MLAMFFLLSLYQQQVLHLSALQTGVNYLPLTALLMLCAFAAPTLVKRVGLRAVLFVGCALAAGGVVLMSRADPSAGAFANVIGPSLVAAPGLALTLSRSRWRPSRAWDPSRRESRRVWPMPPAPWAAPSAWPASQRW